MLKELGAKWLVEMAQYFVDNPQIIVNGFIKSGITGALLVDGHQDETNGDEADYSSTNVDSSTTDGYYITKIIAIHKTCIQLPNPYN